MSSVDAAQHVGAAGAVRVGFLDVAKPDQRVRRERACRERAGSGWRHGRSCDLKNRHVSVLRRASTRGFLDPRQESVVCGRRPSDYRLPPIMFPDPDYSARSATIGSTRVARRAGDSTPAPRPDEHARRSRRTSAGSAGRTPNSSVVSSAPPHRATGDAQRARRCAVTCRPSPTTSRKTSRARGAERHPHADLRGALRDRIGHHAVDADRRQRERQHRERRRRATRRSAAARSSRGRYRRASRCWRPGRCGRLTRPRARSGAGERCRVGRGLQHTFMPGFGELPVGHVRLDAPSVPRAPRTLTSATTPMTVNHGRRRAKRMRLPSGSSPGKYFFSRSFR